jgi:hypothetical protein
LKQMSDELNPNVPAGETEYNSERPDYDFE